MAVAKLVMSVPDLKAESPSLEMLDMKAMVDTVQQLDDNVFGEGATAEMISNFKMLFDKDGSILKETIGVMEVVCLSEAKDFMDAIQATIGTVLELDSKKLNEMSDAEWQGFSEWQIGMDSISNLLAVADRVGDLHLRNKTSILAGLVGTFKSLAMAVQTTADDQDEVPPKANTVKALSGLHNDLVVLRQNLQVTGRRAVLLHCHLSPPS